MSSLSAAGQAQGPNSQIFIFQARLFGFEEKRSKLLSWPRTRPRQLLRPFPSQKKESFLGEEDPGGGVQIDTRILYQRLAKPRKEQSDREKKPSRRKARAKNLMER